MACSRLHADEAPQPSELETSSHTGKRPERQHLMLALGLVAHAHVVERTTERRSERDGDIPPLLLGGPLPQLTLDAGADLGKPAVVERPDEDDAGV
jgi:hypothetical protein